MILVGVSLLIIAIYYYRQFQTKKEEEAKKTFPEVVAPCPDYFADEGNGRCKDIQNLRNRGNCPDQIIDFGSAEFKGPNGNLAKCRKIKHCGVSWEGIDTLCTSASALRLYS